MLKLSKRVEYALLAVQMMAHDPDAIVSAKDIAARFAISFPLIAKVLQQLVHAGYVRSYHGVRGGYALAVPSSMISVADIIHAVEGAAQAIVGCQDVGREACAVHDRCTIREPLAILQDRIIATFSSMTVAELVRQPSYVAIDVPAYNNDSSQQV